MVVVTFVPVAFVNVRPWSDVVPVAVIFDAVSPPYKVRVAVATDPLLVTVSRVSDSTVAGQFVPFARQTDWPETEMVFSINEEPEAEVKARFVVVALVEVTFPNTPL